jgi:TPR repeat protein
VRAEAGDAEAQFDLGGMYRNGNGVPQDHVQAHTWYNLAASRAAGEAGERAAQGCDIVAGRMDPTQIAEAQRLAREWDAAHPREP